MPAGSDEERRLLKAMLTTIGETVLTESESFGHAYVPYLQKSIELPPRVSSVDGKGESSWNSVALKYCYTIVSNTSWASQTTVMLELET